VLPITGGREVLFVIGQAVGPHGDAQAFAQIDRAVIAEIRTSRAGASVEAIRRASMSRYRCGAGRLWVSK